jgi:Cu(I)/Ag(I) efflux system membrane protein CusA/SilA
MIAAIVEQVLRYRLIVGLIIGACVLASIYAIRPRLDAIPDISDPQIIVYAKWPRSPSS